MTTPIQQHLLVKAYSSKTMREEDQLKDLLTDLVSEVGMKIATLAQAKYIDDPGNEGLTGTIGLSTSHASVHIFDEPDDIGGMVMFDLYSCAEFDVLDVLRFISNRLNFIKVEYKVIDRDDPTSYDSIYFPE